MKVLKPHWVSHDDLPIYSVDIHPDGTRFATGGQGEDSGRVVIWNMQPVADVAAEMDDKVPKMLCQLNNHLACVNCVRWSYSGKYLASGGDDKLVMIWIFNKSSTGSNSVFGSKVVNVESWRCVSTLKRHDGDVLDIAWSPHDVWLATSSVDNTVIVWDMNKLPEVVAVLKGHTGLVKGVTWDPVGKYLASQSDDKSLRIWRTADWQEETIVEKPFKKCAGTTLVLRLSWSPDGQYLVSAHAMNNSAPTAQIIDRDGWRHDIDFVGHRKAVTCVRFNSNMLQRDFAKSGKPQVTCCCALGSRDRGVSVWVTALKRPLLAMENLFSRPVLDLSWSAGGLQLMACSLDGTVAYLEFTEAELGRPLTVEEKNNLHEKTYGKSFTSGQPASAVVLETPALVVPSRKPVKVVEEPETAPAVVKTQPAAAQLNSKPLLNKQIETRTADGRRRITPVFIPPAADMGETPAPFTSDHIQFSSSSEAKSRIVIERRDEVVNPNVSTPVTPRAEVKESRLRMLEDAGNVQKPVAPFRRNLDKTLSVITRKSPSKPAETRVACASSGVEKASLSCPQLLPVTKHMIAGSSKCLVIENESCLSPFGRLTQVSLLTAGKPVWKTVLGSAVCVYAAASTLTALACVDGSLHLLDTVTGGRLMPVILLGVPTAHLALSGTKLLCVTTHARLYVWCTERNTNIVHDVSLQPVLTGTGERISRCSVTQAGVPTIVFDSGRAVLYSLQWKSWMRLADYTDATVRSTQKSFQSAWQNLPDSGSAPLRTIQSLCHNSVERGLMHRVDNSSTCTLSYLEEQLSICKTLHSPNEFRFWFITNIRFLLQEGLECRLRLVCESLMTESAENSPWNPTSLGIDKLELLQEVMAELSTSPQAQRLYTEFNEQIKYLS